MPGVLLSPVCGLAGVGVGAAEAAGADGAPAKSLIEQGVAVYETTHCPSYIMTDVAQISGAAGETAGPSDRRCAGVHDAVGCGGGAGAGRRGHGGIGKAQITQPFQRRCKSPAIGRAFCFGQGRQKTPPTESWHAWPIQSKGFLRQTRARAAGAATAPGCKGKEKSTGDLPVLFGGFYAFVRRFIVRNAAPPASTKRAAQRAVWLWSPVLGAPLWVETNSADTSTSP